MSRGCALDLNPEGMTYFGRERNALAQAQERLEEQERVEDPERMEEQERVEGPERAEEQERLEEPERAEEQERLEEPERPEQAWPPLQDQPAPMEAEPAISPLELEELDPLVRFRGSRRCYRLLNRSALRRRHWVVDEMEVTIGSGVTIIARARYELVQWVDFETATRNMLIAVFSKRVLSTHTLNGRAYPGDVRTPRLNRLAVRDIVIEITRRFRVTPRHVREVIEAKCLEEYERARLLELRQRQLEFDDQVVRLLTNFHRGHG